MNVTIRHAEPDDYDRIITSVDAWWGRDIGEALYQRLFVAAASRGCHEVLAVTTPTNQGSIAFHSRMGFTLLPGPCSNGEIPFTPAYDGLGEDRVRFRRPLRDPPMRSPSS